MFVSAYIGISILFVLLLTKVEAQSCPAISNVAQACVSGSYTGPRILLDMSTFTEQVADCTCAFTTDSSVLKIVTYNAPNYQDCNSAIRLSSSSGNSVRFQCLMSGTYLDTSVHNTGDINMETYAQAYDTNYCLVMEHAGVNTAGANITISCNGPAVTSFPSTEFTELLTGNDITTSSLGDSTYLDTAPLTSTEFPSNPQSTTVPSTAPPSSVAPEESVSTASSINEPVTSVAEDTTTTTQFTEPTVLATTLDSANSTPDSTTVTASSKAQGVFLSDSDIAAKAKNVSRSPVLHMPRQSEENSTDTLYSTTAATADSITSNVTTQPAALSTTSYAETETVSVLSDAVPTTTIGAISSAGPISTDAFTEPSTEGVSSTSMPSATSDVISSAGPIFTETVTETNTPDAVSSTPMPSTTIESISSAAPISTEARSEPSTVDNVSDAATSVTITTKLDTITISTPETGIIIDTTEHLSKAFNSATNTEASFSSSAMATEAVSVSSNSVSSTSTAAPDTTASEVHISTEAITLSSTKTDATEAPTTVAISSSSQQNVESNVNVETTTGAPFTSSSTNVATNPTTVFDSTNTPASPETTAYDLSNTSEAVNISGATLGIEIIPNTTYFAKEPETASGISNVDIPTTETATVESETAHSTTKPIHTSPEAATVTTLNLTSFESGASGIVLDIQPGEENITADIVVSNDTTSFVEAASNSTETSEVITDIITGTVLLHGGNKSAKKYEHIDPALAKMYEDTTNISANMFLPPETREAVGMGVVAERIGGQAGKIGETTTPIDTFGVNNRMQDITTKSFWMEPGSPTDMRPMSDTSTNIYGLTDAAPSTGVTTSFGISEMNSGINSNAFVSDAYSQSTTTDLNPPANYGIDTATQANLPGSFGANTVTNNYPDTANFRNEMSTTMYRTPSADWMGNSAVNAGGRNDATPPSNSWDTSSNAYAEGNTNTYPTNTNYGATRDYSSSDSYSYWLTESNNSTGPTGSDVTTDLPANTHDFMGTNISSETTTTIDSTYNTSDIYGVNEPVAATVISNDTTTNAYDASFVSDIQSDITNQFGNVPNNTNDVVISKIDGLVTTEQVPIINSNILSTTDSYSSSGTYNVALDIRSSDSPIDARFKTDKTTTNYASVDPYTQPDLTNQYDYFPNDANNKIDATTTEGSAQTSTNINNEPGVFSYNNNTSSDTNNTEIQVSTERQTTDENILSTEATPSVYVPTDNYPQPDISNQYDITQNDTNETMSDSTQHGFQTEQMLNISSEHPANYDTVVPSELLNNDTTTGSTEALLPINTEPVIPTTEKYNYFDNTNMLETRTASYDYTSDKTIVNTDSPTNVNAIPTMTPRTPEVGDDMMRPGVTTETHMDTFNSGVSNVITSGNETDYSVPEPYTYETLGVIPTEAPTTSANNEIYSSQPHSENPLPNNIESTTMNPPQWPPQSEDETVTTYAAIPAMNDTMGSINTGNSATDYNQTASEAVNNDISASDMAFDTNSTAPEVQFPTDSPAFNESSISIDSTVGTQSYGSKWGSSILETNSTRPDIQYPTDAPYFPDPSLNTASDVNAKRPDVQYPTDAPFYVDPSQDMSADTNSTSPDVQYPIDAPFYVDPSQDMSANTNSTTPDVQYPTDASYFPDPSLNKSSDINAKRPDVQYPTDAPFYVDPSQDMSADTNSTTPDIQYPTDAPFYVDPSQDMSANTNSTTPDVQYPTDAPYFEDPSMNMSSDTNSTAPDAQYPTDALYFEDPSMNMSSDTNSTAPDTQYPTDAPYFEDPIMNMSSDTNSTDPYAQYPTDAPYFEGPSMNMSSDTNSTAPDAQYPTDAPYFEDPSMNMSSDTNSTDPDAQYPTDAPYFEGPSMNMSSDTNSTAPDAQYPTDAPYFEGPSMNMSSDTNSTDPDAQYPTDAPYFEGPSMNMSSDTNSTDPDAQYHTDAPYFEDQSMNLSADTNSTAPDAQYPTDAPYFVDPSLNMTSDTNSTRPDVQYPTDAPIFTEGSLPVETPAGIQQYGSAWVSSVPETSTSSTDAGIFSSSMDNGVSQSTTDTVTTSAATGLFTDTAYFDSASEIPSTRPWVDSNWEATNALDQSTTPSAKNQQMWTSTASIDKNSNTFDMQTTHSSIQTDQAGLSLTTEDYYAADNETVSNNTAVDPYSFDNATSVNSTEIPTTVPYSYNSDVASTSTETAPSTDYPGYPSYHGDMTHVDVNAPVDGYQGHSNDMFMNIYDSNQNADMLENDTVINIDITLPPASGEVTTTTTESYGNYGLNVALNPIDKSSDTGPFALPSQIGDSVDNNVTNIAEAANDTTVTGNVALDVIGGNNSYMADIDVNNISKSLLGVSSFEYPINDTIMTHKEQTMDVQHGNNTDPDLYQNGNNANDMTTKHSDIAYLENTASPLVVSTNIEETSSATPVNIATTNTADNIVFNSGGTYDNVVENVNNYNSFQPDMSESAKSASNYNVDENINMYNYNSFHPENSLGEHVVTDSYVKDNPVVDIKASVSTTNGNVDIETAASTVQPAAAVTTDVNAASSTLNEITTSMPAAAVTTDTNVAPSALNEITTSMPAAAIATDASVASSTLDEINTSMPAAAITTDANVASSTHNEITTSMPVAAIATDVNVASSISNKLTTSMPALASVEIAAVEEFPLSHSGGIANEVTSPPATDPFDHIYDQGRTNSFINNDLVSTESQVVTKTVVKLEDTLDSTLPITDVDMFPATDAMPEDTGVTKSETETPAAVPTAPEHVSDDHVDEVPVTETMIVSEIKPVEARPVEGGHSMADMHDPATMSDSVGKMSFKSGVTTSGVVSSSSSDSASTATETPATTTRTMTTPVPKQTSTTSGTTTATSDAATTPSDTATTTTVGTTTPTTTTSTTSTTTTTEVQTTKQIMPEIIAKDTINKLEAPARPPPIEVKPATRDERPMLDSRPPAVGAEPATRRPFAPRIPESSTAGTVVDGVTEIGTTQKGDINVHFGDDTFQAGSFFDMDNKTYIVVVAAIAGLVVLAIVLGIVIHHSRKHRSEKVDISGVTGEGGLQPISHRNLAYEHIDPEKGNGIPAEPSGNNGTSPEANGNDVTAANGYKGSIEA